MKIIGIFVGQCIVIYTLGLRLYVHMVDEKNMSVGGAKAAVFFVCLPVTLIAAEIFHRLIDQPSKVFGWWFYTWTRA